MRSSIQRKLILASLAPLLIAVLVSVSAVSQATTASMEGGATTPIQHIVVIFQENVSFDHYFGTYPIAANPPNEPQFTAKPDTPSVVGLTGSLLTDNPNEIATGNPPTTLQGSTAQTR